MLQATSEVGHASQLCQALKSENDRKNHSSAWLIKNRVEKKQGEIIYGSAWKVCA